MGSTRRRRNHGDSLFGGVFKATFGTLLVSIVCESAMCFSNVEFIDIALILLFSELDCDDGGLNGIDPAILLL